MHRLSFELTLSQSANYNFLDCYCYIMYLFFMFNI